MFNKLKKGIKIAISSKPITYTAKKKPPMSMGRPAMNKKPFKAPNYKGANFIKKK